MFRIYMVISSFFIFISQKAGYGYGRITTVDSSETRTSGAGDLLASCFNRCENMSDEMKEPVCGIPDRASGERGTG